MDFMPVHCVIAKGNIIHFAERSGKYSGAFGCMKKTHELQGYLLLAWKNAGSFVLIGATQTEAVHERTKQMTRIAATTVSGRLSGAQIEKPLDTSTRVFAEIGRVLLLARLPVLRPVLFLAFGRTVGDESTVAAQSKNAVRMSAVAALVDAEAGQPEQTPARLGHPEPGPGPHAHFRAAAGTARAARNTHVAHTAHPSCRRFHSQPLRSAPLRSAPHRFASLRPRSAGSARFRPSASAPTDSTLFQ